MSSPFDKLSAKGPILGRVLSFIGSAILFVLKLVFIRFTDIIWGGLFRWLDSIRPRILVFIFAPFTIGLIAIVIVENADRYLMTDIYCVKACHVMEHPYKELKKSKHWNTKSGLRATCVDCHVSGRVTFAMWKHFMDTGELWVWYTTDFSEEERFDWLRPPAAQTVRLKMLEEDSETCRKCHVEEAIIPESKRGQEEHKKALEEGTTCIVCHYNLVHKKVKPSVRFLKRIDELDALNKKRRMAAKEKEEEEAEKGVFLQKLDESD